MNKVHITQTKFIKGLGWFSRARLVNDLVDTFKNFAEKNKNYAPYAGSLVVGELTETREYNARFKRHTTVFYLPINYYDENDKYCHDIVCLNDSGIIGGPIWLDVDCVKDCFDNFMFNRYGESYIKFLKKFLSAREEHEQTRIKNVIRNINEKNGQSDAEPARRT